jgi:hypothetical protein
MKLNIKSIAAAILTAGILGQAAFAADTVEQTVNFSVAPINEISVSSASVTIPTIVSTLAGADPEPVLASGGTYAITTNETGKKITGSIDTNMNPGMALEVRLDAPTGGSISNSFQLLTTTAVDLVNGLSTLSESGNAIVYRLTTTAEAGVVSESRVLTLTIADEA